MSVICITGATAGIGLATAERFLVNGWKVIATGRRKERLDALNQKYPGQVLALEFDVRDKEAVATAFASLPEEFKNIDVLMNNAGLGLGLSPAHECELDDWETMVDTNIKGTLYVTRAVLPRMVARKQGYVINLGSIAGTYAYPGGNVYGATKGFMLQFSRGLRCDVHGTGIRVSDIEPGLLESEFSQVRFKGDEQKVTNLYKNGNPLIPEDVAETVWWLVSLPERVNVTQVEIMPTTQSLAAARVYRGEE